MQTNKGTRPGFPESGHNVKAKRRGGLTGKQYRKWRKRQAKRMHQAEGKVCR